MGFFFLEWPNARIANALEITQSNVRSQKSKLAQKILDNPDLMNWLIEEWPIGKGKREHLDEMIRQTPMKVSA